MCQCINKLPDGTECGNLSDVLESNLIAGDSKGCSECANRKLAEKINIGDSYRKLKVLNVVNENLYDERTLDKNKEYLCEC